MKAEQNPSLKCFVDLLRQNLEKEEVVQIDDLGIFMPGTAGKFRFVPNKAQRIFIAYVQEDAVLARKLYADLSARGFSPWMDKKKLLPGQNWPRAIEAAIETSDFFVPCFSCNSVSKRGVFHSELRYALECAARMPVNKIFVIPVRLDHCPVPQPILEQLHYVDLFPEWRPGVDAIVAAMHEQMTERGRKRRQLFPIFFLRRSASLLSGARSRYLR